MTTDTTREGLPELPSIRDRLWSWKDIADGFAEYGQQCYAAAKADELAFLEGLWYRSSPDVNFWHEIDNRIRDLKGEK